MISEGRPGSDTVLKLHEGEYFHSEPNNEMARNG